MHTAVGRHRVDHGFVTGEVGLAGQHVHRLGPGAARQELQRERHRPGAGVGLDLVLVVVGVERTDQDLARLQPAHLLVGRPLHLQDDVAVPGRRRVADHGPGRRQGLVADRGAGPGAALDHRLQAQRLVPLDRVRRRRRTQLAVLPLLGYPDLHVRCLPYVWAKEPFVGWQCHIRMGASRASHLHASSENWASRSSCRGSSSFTCAPASWRSGCMLISGADGLSVAERMRAHDQRDHRISEPRQRLHIMRLPTELSL